VLREAGTGVLPEAGTGALPEAGAGVFPEAGKPTRSAEESTRTGVQAGAGEPAESAEGPTGFSGGGVLAAAEDPTEPAGTNSVIPGLALISATVFPGELGASMLVEAEM
jgi:hypothetical protein